MTAEQKIIAEGRRFAKAQQARIAAQRQFIHDLEMQGEDASIVRLQKENLGVMLKSLDVVLRRLRPVIEKETSQQDGAADH